MKIYPESGRTGEGGGGLRGALHRAHSWRVPPNWSSLDWFDEVKAITVAAANHAEVEFDPARHVPLSAFIYSRALASAWTRYRQEWAYTLHCGCGANEERDGADVCRENGPEFADRYEEVRDALEKLSENDQRLLKQLFWTESTEAEIGERLEISQQAVSKRKRSVLARLRHTLEPV